MKFEANAEIYWIYSPMRVNDVSLTVALESTEFQVFKAVLLIKIINALNSFSERPLRWSKFRVFVFVWGKHHHTSVYVCVVGHTYNHACTDTNRHTYTRIHSQAHLYTYLQIRIHAHTCAHLCQHVNTHTGTCTPAWTHLHICMCPYMHDVYIHANARVHMHMGPHACTCTFVHIISVCRRAVSSCIWALLYTDTICDVQGWAYSSRQIRTRFWRLGIYSWGFSCYDYLGVKGRWY